MQIVVPTHGRALVSGIAFGKVGSSSSVVALAKTHADWWEQKNVLGLCLARRRTNHLEGQLALQVLVKKKLFGESLKDRHRVPAQVEFEYEGQRQSLATDVREVGSPKLETLVSCKRPAQPGFNIGNELSGSGTLCCAATQRNSGQLLGISCGHVIARYGRAKAGERVYIPSKSEAVGTEIPLSSADIGSIVDVGQISSVYEDAANNVDAASFAPDNPTQLDELIALLGVRPTTIRDEVPLGLPVYKVGYMTGLTAGLVQAVHVTVSFPFPFKGGAKSVWFTDQIGISRLCTDGDSGALIVDQGGAAIGIHIGSFGEMSICTPIRKVLDALGCDLGRRTS